MLSHVQVFATPWTVAHQIPLSMEFPRQKYWSGLLFPSLEDLLGPGIESASPALAGPFFTTEPPGKPQIPRSLSTVHSDSELKFMNKGSVGAAGSNFDFLLTFLLALLGVLMCV